MTFNEASQKISSCYFHSDMTETKNVKAGWFGSERKLVFDAFFIKDGRLGLIEKG